MDRPPTPPPQHNPVVGYPPLGFHNNIAPTNLGAEVSKESDDMNNPFTISDEKLKNGIFYEAEKIDSVYNYEGDDEFNNNTGIKSFAGKYRNSTPQNNYFIALFGSQKKYAYGKYMYRTTTDEVDRFGGKRNKKSRKSKRNKK